MTVADFRSDTVTRPCADMRRAMSGAEVGDDVFGDDPTVIRLQEAVAERFDAEASLFLPSGTMANQVGVKVLTQPGNEVLCEEQSHVFLYEVGGLGLISGVQSRPLPGDPCVPSIERLEAALRPDDIHEPRTALITVENTHNRAGGRVVPLATLQEVRAFARQHGVHLYLDGARLVNASVATGTPLPAYAREVDLLGTCLSKGLGCPAGSMLVGPADRIAECRRLRKALGGGMRQAGILAAAGLFALQHLMERVAEDHARARRLAEGLAELPGWQVDLPSVETNIVLVRRASRDANAVTRHLAEHGVWASTFGAGIVRFVTHRDVHDGDVDQALRAAREVPAAGSGD